MRKSPSAGGVLASPLSPQNGNPACFGVEAPHTVLTSFWWQVLSLIFQRPFEVSIEQPQPKPRVYPIININSIITVKISTIISIINIIIIIFIIIITIITIITITIITIIIFRTLLKIPFEQQQRTTCLLTQIPDPPLASPA